MVTTNYPVIILEKDGMKMILTLEEAKKVKQDVDSFLAKNGLAQDTFDASKYANSDSHSEPVHMSDGKRKRLKDHIVSRLTEKPQPLTKLLDGASYVPNYLPVIRQMVEEDKSIGKVMKGRKRALYFKK
jgi:primosomal protein N'